MMQWLKIELGKTLTPHVNIIMTMEAPAVVVGILLN